MVKPDSKYEVTAAAPGQTDGGRTGGAGAAGLGVGASVAQRAILSGGRTGSEWAKTHIPEHFSQ